MSTEKQESVIPELPREPGPVVPEPEVEGHAVDPNVAHIPPGVNIPKALTPGADKPGPEVEGHAFTPDVQGPAETADPGAAAP
jgi:hypothetical protein